MIDKRFVLLNENDNILVCCKQVNAADNVKINGQDFVMEININVGHKLARTAIEIGDNILITQTCTREESTSALNQMLRDRTIDLIVGGP